MTLRELRNQIDSTKAIKTLPTVKVLREMKLKVAAKRETADSSVTVYWLAKGIKKPGKGKQQPPTKWNSSTITKILSLQEYCGDVLNFKTYSKSYKNKKRIVNDRDNWVVFKDVHEPIIERTVYEQIQEKRGKMRKRCTNDGEKNMFSGLLVCADCGCNLHYHFNQGNPDIKYFNCSNYKGNRGTCTSTHYIRVDFLERVVLGEIRRLTKYASTYEDEFLKEVVGHVRQEEENNRKMKEKSLKRSLLETRSLTAFLNVSMRTMSAVSSPTTVLPKCLPTMILNRKRLLRE